MALPLANSADSDLAKQVQYLKAEKQILRNHLGKRPFRAEADTRSFIAPNVLTRLGGGKGPHYTCERLAAG